MVQFTAPYNLPLIESTDKIASVTAGENLREDINALAGAANTALGIQGGRVDVVEAVGSANGEIVTNAVIDPVPVVADITTHNGSRVTLAPVDGRGRATCTEVGATSFYPKASTAGLTSITSRFPVAEGAAVTATVTLFGHPTQAMQAQLSLPTYRWDGAAFVTGSAGTLFTTALTLLPAGGQITLELGGVIPASDTTHVLPTVTYRRNGETYPQIGDYIDWARFGLQIGGLAPAINPAPYTDGTAPGGYWLGAPNGSPSRGVFPTGRDIVFNGSRRNMAVSAFKARRADVIGTSGKAALSFRVDHGIVNHKAKALPLFQKYNTPWGIAINPENIGDATNLSTLAEVQSLCIDNGGEAANHGGNHLDAVGRVAIRQQIIGSKDIMDAGMPGLAVEMWMPPGLANGGYGGYSPMSTLEQHWNTYAGQLILSAHAGVSGYIPGLYRALPADMPLGLSHGTIDAQTTATVQGWVDGAIAAGAGICLMLHPVYLDTPGYLTTAQLETIIAYVAAKRDAGLLDILTPSGLLLADPGSDYRHNLISNSRFQNTLTGWGNITNWAVVDGTGFKFARTTTGTPLTQTVSMDRKEPMLGGARELVYRVRATTGAVVRTNVTGTGVAASKDHTLTASANWVEVRKPVTIPLNLSGDLTVAVGRVSGGVVDIADIRLQTI